MRVRIVSLTYQNRKTKYIWLAGSISSFTLNSAYLVFAESYSTTDTIDTSRDNQTNPHTKAKPPQSID